MKKRRFVLSFVLLGTLLSLLILTNSVIAANQVYLTDGSDNVRLKVSDKDSWSRIIWGDDFNDRFGFFFGYWNEKKYPGTTKEVMTLLPNGNVGIGTTHPDYKLEVNGAIKASRICFPDGSCLNSARNIGPNPGICRDGEIKCESDIHIMYYSIKKPNDAVLYCKNGKWVKKEYCKYGCSNGTCIGSNPKILKTKTSGFSMNRWETGDHACKRFGYDRCVSAVGWSWGTKVISCSSKNEYIFGRGVKCEKFIV